MTFHIKLIILYAMISLASCGEGEPQYRIMEDHSMEAPITHKEFQNWVSLGSSLFHKNTIVLVPEIKDKKGAFYNKVKNANKDAWIVDIKLRMGNEERSKKGGNGFGFYYLRDIQTDEIGK